jgi:hypothetical protein
VDRSRLSSQGFLNDASKFCTTLDLPPRGVLARGLRPKGAPLFDSWWCLGASLGTIMHHLSALCALCALCALGRTPEGGAKHVKSSLGLCESAALPVQALYEKGVLTPGKAF